MTKTLGLLILLGGPWGSDPAFYVIWSRFPPRTSVIGRQALRGRTYLPSFGRRLHWVPGHGPIHKLCYGDRFSWDSEQEGWIRAGLSPLRMVFGPVQHFHSTIFQAWQQKVATDLCNNFGVSIASIFTAHIKYFCLLILEKVTRLLRSSQSGVSKMGYQLQVLRCS